MSEGSLRKYFEISKDGLNKPIHWPGTVDGFPFRGDLGTTTQKEYENIPLVYDAKCQIFELPSQMEEYLLVIDRCANGWYRLRHERFLGWDPVTKSESVFLQWLEIYGEPSGAKSADFAETGIR